MGCMTSHVKNTPAVFDDTRSEASSDHQDEPRSILVSPGTANIVLRADEGSTPEGCDTLNEYVVQSQVAKSIFATVFLATSRQTGETRAIKRYRREDWLRSCALQYPSRFTQSSVFGDVQQLQRMKHPNVANVFELINDQNSTYLYLVMQHAAKGPVGRVDREGLCYPMYPAEQLLTMLDQAISGLRYIHRLGVYHGAMKPENLLLDDKGTVLVADSALSGHLALNLKSPSLFCAPEMLGQSPTPPSEETDVWALGVTFYALLTGQVPFYAASCAELIAAIRSAPILFPSTISPMWAEMLKSMLRRNPTQRVRLRFLKRFVKAEMKQANMSMSSPIPGMSSAGQRSASSFDHPLKASFEQPLPAFMPFATPSNASESSLMGLLRNSAHDDYFASGRSRGDE